MALDVACREPFANTRRNMSSLTATVQVYAEQTEPAKAGKLLRMTSGTAREDQGAELPTARTAKLLVLFGLVPMLGVILFAVAGALGLRAFSHNNSLSCGFDSPASGTGACAHYSYALPVAVGVLALLLLIGGGAFASYYTMRSVGLPLFAALRRRSE